MSNRMTAERKAEIKELLKNSTSVNAWYAHSEDSTVRGPYVRWFKCLEVDPQYKERVSSTSDDVKYAACAMNAIPELLTELEAVEAELKDVRLHWEDDIRCVNKALDERDSLRTSLLESQARELQFRDACEAFRKQVETHGGDYHGAHLQLIIQALEAPPPDIAEVVHKLVGALEWYVTPGIHEKWKAEEALSITAEARARLLGEE